jgi:hypothetical protein
VTPSLIALCAANTLPIVGVLFLGWTVFPIVLLYWLENVVVGAFNVLKMLLARPQELLSNLGKLFFVPFFVVHFGLFTFVHGMLVFAFFGPRDAEPFGLTANLFPTIRANHLGWAVLVLVASHGLSFYWNYLGNGEFRRASMQVLMQQPYGRVVVLHLTVLFGGWIVIALGSPVLALVLLVALKTAADVRAHRAERRFAPADAG